MDRARYLRDAGYETAARAACPRGRTISPHRPADPERFYEMLLLLARGAAADRQCTTAYDIARQVDDASRRAPTSARSRSASATNIPR